MATVSADDVNRYLRGFDRLYGIRFREITDTLVLAELEMGEELSQPMGLLHGGVYAAMAESMTSIATALAVAGDGEMAMGQSNSTSFLRPITAGTVHATGTRVHRGRTTWLWDVQFSDDAGRSCALTRMTIAVRPWPEGRAPLDLPASQPIG